MSEMIHVKVRLAQGTDHYVIRDVSADDEGHYFCRASNAYGVKEASVDVRMLGTQLFTVFRFSAISDHNSVLLLKVMNEHS